jgi:hypothetical protein
MRLNYERLLRRLGSDASEYSDESPLISTTNPTPSKSILLRRISLRRRSKLPSEDVHGRKIGGMIRSKYAGRLNDRDDGYETEDERSLNNDE